MTSEITLSAGVIDQSRLANITALDRGTHDPGASMCAMEAAAYIAGEPWSDHPECVCPVIGAFMRSWNDALPDAERSALLLPLIAKTIGTRGSDALANRRAVVATDWLIRVNTPAWLRLAGLTEQADALAKLPEITDFAKMPGLMPTLKAVRKDAARAVARATARVAADAALDAAWDASRAVAWGVAFWTGPRVVAWGVALAAVWAAATKKLAATKTELQASAVQLVERMCALTEEDLT